jgi:hypothetical protein
MIAVRIDEEIRGVVVAAPGYLARHPRRRHRRISGHTTASASVSRAA